MNVFTDLEAKKLSITFGRFLAHTKTFTTECDCTDFELIRQACLDGMPELVPQPEPLGESVAVWVEELQMRGNLCMLFFFW